MVRQGGNIFFPFAERRQHDGNHVQAVIEILPETAIFHILFQVLVCSGDHPDIHFYRLGASHRFELLLLEHP